MELLIGVIKLVLFAIMGIPLICMAIVAVITVTVWIISEIVYRNDE